MRTKLKSIDRIDVRGHGRSAYSSVLVRDEQDTEYTLNFPADVTEAQVRQTWEQENCWRVI